jgi:transcriptional regulator with XRE-family HTH domain
MVGRMSAVAKVLGFRHEQIRRLREGLGLTQQEFADRIGVTKQAISAWEIGRSEPSMAKFLQLVNLTGARIESFFLAA